MSPKTPTDVSWYWHLEVSKILLSSGVILVSYSILGILVALKVVVETRLAQNLRVFVDNVQPSNIHHETIHGLCRS
jgi:hypothetical protein